MSPSAITMFISQASIEDVEAILKLQKIAYQSEARLYNDFSISRLTQTLEQIKADFATPIVFMEKRRSLYA